MLNFGCRGTGGASSRSSVPGYHQRPISRGFAGSLTSNAGIGLVVVQVARHEVGAHRWRQWIVLPSMNHSWCTPRDRGPEQSKKLMLRGCSGVGDVEQLDPAGVAPCVLVWYATAMISPQTSSELERTLRCGSSVCTMTRGLRRIGDIDTGEILRRAFVRHPQNAPSAGRELHAHALADIAEAGRLSCEIRRKLWASGCAMGVSPPKCREVT